MILQAYDPTRGYLVPINQARVIAYVIDTETGKRYSTVAEAENAIAEANAASTPKPKTVTSTTYEGSGKNRVKVTKYSDGTEERVADPEAVDTAAKRVITGSGTKDDPLKVDGKVFTGTLPENNVYYENGVVFVYTPPASESKTTASLTPTDKTSFDKTINEIVSTGGKTDIGYTFGTATGEPMPGSVVPSATGMKTFNYIPVSSMSETQKKTYGIVLTDPNIDAVFFDQDTGTMYYRFKDGSRGAGDKGAFYRDPLGNIRPSSEIPYNYSTGFYPSGSGGVVTEPYTPFSTYSGVSGVSTPGTLASGSTTYTASGAPSFTSSTTLTSPSTATNTGMTAGQQDIYSIVVDRLNRYNLGSLAPLIKKLAIEGATEATIMLRLQEEPLYQERFKANQSRIAKGLKALTPSEYITLEDDYRQVLRAYGLTQFDNDSYVSQFLANDISVSELSNRVVAAVQRVRNADPAISSMLKSYYGISNNDLVAYVLDPNQQFQKIERQIAASEIGVAAGRQGINIGVPVAEQLAAQGITQAEAQRGYATIADILPTAKKLSDIYGNVLEGYDLPEAEQEVFNQLASAQRKRKALTEREIAAFSGTSGLGRTSLTQQSGGQF